MSDRQYIVKSGDTLSRIATVMYGDASLYPRIRQANGGSETIHTGQVLIIPDITERKAPASQSAKVLWHSERTVREFCRMAPVRARDAYFGPLYNYVNTLRLLYNLR